MGSAKGWGENPQSRREQKRNQGEAASHFSREECGGRTEAKCQKTEEGAQIPSWTSPCPARWGAGPAWGCLSPTWAPRPAGPERSQAAQDLLAPHPDLTCGTALLQVLDSWPGREEGRELTRIRSARTPSRAGQGWAGPVPDSI